MPLETQVVATAAGLDALPRLSFERHDIVAACRLPQSLAELAARLHLHLNVVRVLAEDLREAGQLAVYVPDAEATRDASVLRRLIDGLRAIPDSRRVPSDTD
jgi:trans-aconitate methyltransferase